MIASDILMPKRPRRPAADDDLRFKLHRPLSVGQRVIVKRGVYAGEHGTVSEVLRCDEHLQLTGLATYGVQFFRDEQVRDYARHELKSYGRKEREERRKERAEMAALFAPKAEGAEKEGRA